MPKKIKVLSRTLSYGDKLLGKGGTYTVSDAFAKDKVNEGKAEIVEDLGNDATPLATNKKIDYEFMDKVKHHAPEIMAILEGEFERRRKEQIADEEYQEQLNKLTPEQVAEAQPPADSTETTTDDTKTEEISTSSENTVPIDEPGGIVTASDNSTIEQSTPIPQDFPGFTALTKKGVHTMEQLSILDYEQLIEMGIRQGTANQIGAKLMELKENNA